MSADLASALIDALDDDALDALAARIAPRLPAQTASPEPWLNVDQAAAHLAVPRSRIYDLSSRSRYPHDAEDFPVHKDPSRRATDTDRRPSYFKASELDQWRSRR